MAAASFGFVIANHLLDCQHGETDNFFRRALRSNGLRSSIASVSVRYSSSSRATEAGSSKV